jgi:predicted amidohydrolase YtcJ
MKLFHIPSRRRATRGLKWRALLVGACLAGRATCVFAGGADALSGEKERTTVEAVYFNGKVHTMDPARPVVEAISVAGGRIVGTGSSRDLLARLAPGTRTIDLGGRAVIPGLTDAHAHFLGFAKLATRLDLVGTASLDEVLGKVSAKLSSARKGDWILGRGWDQNDWPGARYPDRSALDRIAPDNPAYLVRVCGHAAYVNSAALRIAGISRSTPDPAGGKIIRDANGEPTGILLDNAMELVARAIPPLARDEKKRLMIDAARKCLAAGLVGVHEMGIAAEDVSVYEELSAAGDLPFRITGYLSSDDTSIAPLREAGPRASRGDELFRVIGAKFYADGSLGARSAALIEDYADDPGNRGILMQSPESLYQLILPWREKGFQIAVHAIGDDAVREVLDVYERLGAGQSASDARPRIEHAQIVAANDVARFARLAVTPSMQFIHCTSDMPWVEERLGAERLAEAYAWRSLIAAGNRIPGGSDFPVESINPFLGIHAAVTRQDLAGNPAGGWRGEQRLTVEEAVRAFTVDAAWVAHAEDVAGSLAPGKLADFVVLSDDIFSIDPGGIPLIRVLATFLGGEIVYRSDDFYF